MLCHWINLDICLGGNLPHSRLTSGEVVLCLLKHPHLLFQVPWVKKHELRIDSTSPSHKFAYVKISGVSSVIV